MNVAPKKVINQIRLKECLVISFDRFEIYFVQTIYLIIDLDVNLALLSAATNQGREFMEILICDLLPPNERQD